MDIKSKYILEIDLDFICIQHRHIHFMNMNYNEENLKFLNNTIYYYYCIFSRKYLNIKLLNIYYYLMNIDICLVYQNLLSLFPILETEETEFLRILHDNIYFQV